MNPPTAYAPPAVAGEITLDLSKNEGRAPAQPALALLTTAAEQLARYPDLQELQALLARHYAVPEDRLLVTAGGDDALLRLCLCALGGGGGRALVATPTFEMIPRYVALARGTLASVPWPEGPFPTEAMLARAATGEAPTRIAFVVSPNNPTGAVATASDLERIAAALPDALVVLDAAYAEFADRDLTAFALGFDNVVVVRTLSKAWGLAGLRVGCALAAPAVIERLRASGNPMPVSIASARIAAERLRGGGEDLADHVDQVRRQRPRLAACLRQLGAHPCEPCQGNFVLAHGLDAEWTVRALGALGIAVRRFPDRPDLHDAVRIALPGHERTFLQLDAALQTVLRPQALLFDMDGVLADVTRSYREAILATARDFGVELSARDITAMKARGNANDDWQLTRSLLAERGVERPLDEVVTRFEAHYRGLRDRERLMIAGETLRRWRQRFRLGVVTGRPRADAEHFLERFAIRDVFDAVVCREDAALKPDPAPIRLALRQLDVHSAWMLGDTRDDLDAARAARVLPIGVGAELRSDPAVAAGAAHLLDDPELLEELLP